jgi:hypothetical protein
MKKTYRFETNRKVRTIEAVDYNEALDIAECMTEDNPNEVITKYPYEV